jgi:hypothetical protein
MEYLMAVLLAMLLAKPVLAKSESPASKEAFAACPVTAPNGSTPPGEQLGPNTHGNGVLWVVLWPEGGRVVFRPGGARVCAAGWIIEYEVRVVARHAWQVDNRREETRCFRPSAACLDS